MCGLYKEKFFFRDSLISTRLILLFRFKKTLRNLSNQYIEPELIKKNKSYYMNFKHII